MIFLLGWERRIPSLRLYYRHEITSRIIWRWHQLKSVRVACLNKLYLKVASCRLSGPARRSIIWDTDLCSTRGASVGELSTRRDSEFFVQYFGLNKRGVSISGQRLSDSFDRITSQPENEAKVVNRRLRDDCDFPVRDTMYRTRWISNCQLGPLHSYMAIGKRPASEN